MDKKPNCLEGDGSLVSPDSREEGAKRLGIIRRDNYHLLGGNPLFPATFSKGERKIGSLPPISTEAHDTSVVRYFLLPHFLPSYDPATQTFS